jgi:membrane protease YdiL (CAAX protease family)
MDKRKAAAALLLLVPAPSLGVLAAMVSFPNSPTGVILFAASKVWLFAFPVVWHRFVDAGSFSLSPARKGGFGVGFLSGALISLAILLAYTSLGPGLIDASFLVGKMKDIGLASWPTYAGFAAYWIAVNSVLEEYVWRWFVYRQCETLLKPAAAVPCAALFFTLHHIFALHVYLGAAAVAFCSAGIFIGGAFWSFMYRRFQSIWPGYLSHALVDFCIFAVGAFIIFGAH